MIRAIENADLVALSFEAPGDFEVPLCGYRTQTLVIRRGESVVYQPAEDMPGGITWRLNGRAFYGDEVRPLHRMLKAIADGHWIEVKG